MPGSGVFRHGYKTHHACCIVDQTFLQPRLPFSSHSLVSARVSSLAALPCARHRLASPLPSSLFSPFFFLDRRSHLPARMAQGRGLLRLPDVVLGQICSQFCPHCVGEDCVGDCDSPDGFGGAEYFGALAALAQVNVRISRRAQLVRFHVFCDRRDSLPLLVRTLVEQPALAAHLLVVRLGNDNTDREQGCILRQLATSRAVGVLKDLEVPELGADFDLLCAGGEERSVAQILDLSTTNTNTSISVSGATDLSLGKKSQIYVTSNSAMARVSYPSPPREWATLFPSRECELTVAF